MELLQSIMPVWQEPLDEELQKLHLERAIQSLHEAGTNDAMEMLLNCDIEISERIHEDKWQFTPTWY